jgi:hypothetical protein
MPPEPLGVAGVVFNGGLVLPDDFNSVLLRRTQLLGNLLLLFVPPF